MSETTEGVELAIPRAAQSAYDRATVELMVTAQGGPLGSRSAQDNVRAIAAPIVAAELRRLAEMFSPRAGRLETFPEPYEALARRLEIRADELEAT